MADAHNLGTNVQWAAFIVASRVFVSKQNRCGVTAAVSQRSGDGDVKHARIEKRAQIPEERQ